MPTSVIMVSLVIGVIAIIAVIDNVSKDSHEEQEDFIRTVAFPNYPLSIDYVGEEGEEQVYRVRLNKDPEEDEVYRVKLWRSGKGKRFSHTTERV